MFNIGVQQVIPCLIFRIFLSIPKKLAPTTAGVSAILCKRVFGLNLRHAIFELNREAVQGSFPVMNGHGPFPANVV